jgi:hypothetical protein
MHDKRLPIAYGASSLRWHCINISKGIRRKCRKKEDFSSGAKLRAFKHHRFSDKTVVNQRRHSETYR